MARLPHTIIYRFYGKGVPKSRAIKFLTVRLRSQSCDVKDHSLIMTLVGHKQRYFGTLLARLLGGIYKFCDAKSPWFDTVTETEEHERS